MLSKRRKIHFIGMGGIGMSGIAELLLGLGHKVSGSDLKRSPILDRLEKLGARVMTGHSADNVRGAECVVYSSAVPETNAELVEAKRLGLIVMKRAEMLGELIRMKRGILIAGSHGKTTTTSMVAALLHAAGMDPTVCAGGIIEHLGGNARLGAGEYFVAEADESDGSFTHLVPGLAVVTNIDREHMDHYGTMARQRSAFVHFLNQTEFTGTCVLCADDPEVLRIAPRVRRPVVFYGLSRQADVRAEDVTLNSFGSKFVVVNKGRELGEVEIHLPGIHNVSNALAAVTVALGLGADMNSIRKGFSELRTVRRRFQVKGKRDGVTVVDDYAHHPTEIRAALSAARRACRGKVVAVFQPHRYTRTRDQMDSFPPAFADADVLLVLPVYPAGEAPIEGIDSQKLAARIEASGHKCVVKVSDFGAALAEVRSRCSDGDILITLGAGDVYKVGTAFLEGGEL